MIAMLEQAQELKKEAFSKLDRNNKKISVDLNLLIDIILAYESAAEGDTENLNYALKVAHQSIDKYEELLSQIADCVEVDSKAWQLAHTWV